VTEEEARDRAVQHWLRKSADALESARSELLADRYDFAVNRAYYAAFFSASAVLLAHGRHFVKHTGVRAAIHQTLVKPGMLDPRFGRIYDRLFDARQRADYLALTETQAEEAASMTADATEFVVAMRALIGRTAPAPDAV
jgi:uncharacterized protein (UPF0332 family)